MRPTFIKKTVLLALVLLPSMCLLAQMQLRFVAEGSTGAADFGDLNRDGIPDLFRSSNETFSFALGRYDTSGHLQFGMVPNAAFVNSVIFTGVQAGDWDNDGDFDLLPDVHYVYEFHSMLTENRNGVFADTCVKFSAPYPSLQHIDLKDFNKDGWNDVFFCNNSKTYIRDGQTGLPHELPFFPSPRTAALQLLDFNRDGWMDVLQTNGGATQKDMYLFLGKGNFGFETGLLVGPAPGALISDAGDFDGDGIEDLITKPSLYSSNLTILTKLLSSSPQKTTLVAPSNALVFYHDLNADGKMDFVFGKADSFYLKLNQGDGSFRDYTYGMKIATSNALQYRSKPVGAAHDFFVFKYALPIRYNFYFTDDRFTVTASEQVMQNALLNSNNNTNSCLADLDGDGAQELVMGLWDNRGLARCDLTGSGEQAILLYRDFHGAEITGLAAADFDRDKKDEIVFFDRAGGIYIGGLNALGQFELGPALTINANFRNVFEVKIADFDGNGFPDFLFGDNITDQVFVYANQNGQDFVQTAILSDWDLLNAKVVDFDRDGLDDLVLEPYSDPNIARGIYLFHNRGNFVFEKTSHFISDGRLMLSPDAGFFKNFMPVIEGSSVGLYQMAPNGFQRNGGIELGSVIEAALIDFNRDSLPDLYYNKLPGKSGFICLNKGDGTFEKDAALLPFVSVNNVLDTDGDGFPEFLMLYRRDWMLGKAPALAVSALDEPARASGHLSVWPSPAGQSIRLEGPGLQGFKLSLFSAAGQLCKQVDAHANSPIDLAGLPSGVYFLVAENDKGLYFGKFVKQE